MVYSRRQKDRLGSLFIGNDKQQRGRKLPDVNRNKRGEDSTQKIIHNIVNCSLFLFFKEKPELAFTSSWKYCMEDCGQFGHIKHLCILFERAISENHLVSESSKAKTQ